MRLRVLVGAAGNPRPVSAAPFDVLENGVVGARWTVADPAVDAEVSDARAALLRTLQARVGPHRQSAQTLVRLPRRLCGPRLHPSRTHEGGDGWEEAIRWLRGLQPSNWLRDSDIRLAEMWEYEFRRGGLGHPTPQRYPRRTRSRRGRGRRQHDLERELGLRPQRLRGEDVQIRIQHADGTEEALDLQPLTTDLTIEIGPENTDEYLGETTSRFTDAFRGMTLTLEGRIQPENPELPKRPDIGPNDPNPWGVDPTPPTAPALRLADLRRARAELDAAAAPTNSDGTYNAFLGPAEMYELQSDPEFQRLAAGLLHNNVDEHGSVLTIMGLRLFARREPGWSVDPAVVPLDVYRNHAVLDWRRRTFTFRGVEHSVSGEIRTDNQITTNEFLGETVYAMLRTWTIDLESAAALGYALSADRDLRLSLDVVMPGHNGSVRCTAFVRETTIEHNIRESAGYSTVSLVLFDPVR